MADLVKVRYIQRGSISAGKSYANEDETAEITTSPLFRRFVRPCVAEFFGTMIYTFCSCLGFVYLGNQYLTVPICQGLITIALMGSIGHISGAHLNPAVSFGVWIGGGMNFVLFALYLTIQILGAFIGALMFRAVITRAAYLIAEGAVVYINVTNTTKGQAILLELCCEFVTVLVYLIVVVDSDGLSQQSALCVGCTTFAMSLISYSMTRASINPARALSTSITSSVFDEEGVWTDHYIFWIGPFIGAILAASFYRLILAEDRRRLLFKRE